MFDPFDIHSAGHLARRTEREPGTPLNDDCCDPGLPPAEQHRPTDQTPLPPNEAGVRLDNIPGMVFQRQLHPDGTISFPYANNAVQEIAGLDPAIVMTNPTAVSDRIHPDDLDALRTAVKRSFADMQPHSEEFRFHHPTLGWRWFQTISKPRKNSNGTLVADTLALDITDRKETEQELEQNRIRLNEHLIELQDTKERLEQRTDELIRTVGELADARDEAETANRAKSDFLATMSHEIRTPMNGVLGMASLLKLSSLDATQQEFIDTIEQSGEALLQIINDVLDFSKMEAGQFELDPTAFSVLDVIDSAVQLVRPKCLEKSITIRTFAAPQIPDQIIGDAGRFRQILLNLLGNAAKFTASGMITLECFEPNVVGRDIELRIAISDTGIGISEAAQKSLFEVFSQADASTTRRFGGTGLGLSICKRLCHLMDGDITVESTPDVGSTFSFTILCKQTDETLAGAQTPSYPDAPRTALLTAATLEPDTGLVRQLGAYGIATEIFDNAEKILDHLDAFPNEDTLIVLDSGTASGPDDLLDRLRKQHRKTPFTVWVLDSAEPNSIDFGRHLDVPLRQSRIRQYVGGSKIVRGGDPPQPIRSAAKKSEISPPSQLQSPSQSRSKSQSQSEPESDAVPVLSALLVEDNKINQNLAIAILEVSGIGVTLAENGLEAVELLEQHDYDVVLMDIHMPLMDGVAATKAIRALPSPRCDIPIIAVTANAMKGDRETYLDAGMDDYVSKPIDPALLSEAIMRQTKVSTKISSTVQQPKQEEEIAPLLSVLLVEDNKVNQRVAIAMLEAARMDVTLAENGLEALEALQQNDFSIVLMDIHMPQMDGIAAAKAIRALPSPLCDIPIIALTANAMKGDREIYLDAGMNDYVSKPVDPTALSDAILRQAGIASEIIPTVQRAKPKKDLPNITEAEISALFAGLDDILD